MAYAQRQYGNRHDERGEYRGHDGGEHHRKEFSGAHISLGGIKYAVGATALMLLGEKIKSPEQRYLVLAGLGAIVGAIDTAWRDHVRQKERAEREASWRERCERERDTRERERG
jgi:hypothetical protein